MSDAARRLSTALAQCREADPSSLTRDSVEQLSRLVYQIEIPGDDEVLLAYYHVTADLFFLLGSNGDATVDTQCAGADALSHFFQRSQKALVAAARCVNATEQESSLVDMIRRHLDTTRFFPRFFPAIARMSELSGVRVQPVVRQLMQRCVSLATLVYTNADKVMQPFCYDYITDMRQASKFSIYCLQLFTRLFGAGYVLRNCRHGSEAFFAEGARLLRDNHVGTIWSAMIVQLVESYHKEVMTEKESLEAADAAVFAAVGRPLANAIHSSDGSVRILLFSQIVPGVVALSPYFYTQLMKAVQESTDRSSSAAVINELSILCIAKDKQLLGEMGRFVSMLHRNLTLDTDENLSQVGYSVDRVHAYLHHRDANVRTHALRLLVVSRSKVAALPAASLTAIIEHMPYFLNVEEPFDRQELFTLFGTLIQRLKASCHHAVKQADICRALVPKGKATVQDSQAYSEIATSVTHDAERFILSFTDCIVWHLSACSNYFELVSAMKIFTILMQPDYNKAKGEITQFPFPWPVMVDSSSRLLIERMSDRFEDIRNMAFSCLAKHVETLSFDWKAFHDRARAQVMATRANIADGGARMLCLYYLSLGNAGNKLAFLHQLVDEILMDLRSTHGVTREALERPLHGRILALTFIFRTFDYGSNDAIANAGLLESAVSLAQEAWLKTKPILCEDAPEGHVPDEFDEVEEAETSLAQEVSSYSWRTVKEASTLLGTIFDGVPYEPAYGITVEFVSRVSDLFHQWLLEIRHRGAFSAVFGPFVQFNGSLFRQRKNEYANLPGKWLNADLDQVQLLSGKITRRSAGLPMCLVGILVADLDHERRLLNLTMERLTATAQQPVVEGNGKLDLPQVHAMNCIREILIERRLAVASGRFVDDTFILCVQMFAHDVWAIRNCAVMLFTALMRRSFGGRKPREQALKSGSKPLSTQQFFSSYPSLRSFVARMLTEYGSNLRDTGGASTGLFPILNLFSRLGLHGAAITEDEKEFMRQLYGIIASFTSSKQWKIREVAALALPSVVLSEDYRHTLMDLISGLDSRDANESHGRLLCIISLLVNGQLSPIELNSLANKLAEKSSNVLSGSSTFVQALFLRLCHEHFYNFPEVYDASLGFCYGLLEQCAKMNTQHVLGAGILLREAVYCVVRSLSPSPDADAVIVSILQHPSYDARLACLDLLREEYLRHFVTASVIEAVRELRNRDTWVQENTRCTYVLTLAGESSEIEVDAQHSLESCFGKLTHPMYSQRAKEAVLIQIGSLLSTHMNDAITKWSDLILEYSDEFAPTTSRIAAASSIDMFLSKTLVTIESEAIIRTLGSLVDMLDDDDREVMAVARRASEQLVGQSDDHEYILRERLLMWIVHHVDANINVADQFAKAIIHRAGDLLRLNDDSEAEQILFAREKQNLRRNRLVDAELWVGIYAKACTGTNNTQLLNWLQTGVNVLEGFMVRQAQRAYASRYADEDALATSVWIAKVARAMAPHSTVASRHVEKLISIADRYETNPALRRAITS